MAEINKYKYRYEVSHVKERLQHNINRLLTADETLKTKDRRNRVFVTASVLSYSKDTTSVASEQIPRIAAR